MDGRERTQIQNFLTNASESKIWDATVIKMGILTNLPWSSSLDAIDPAC